MLLRDTNVVSELRRPRPYADPGAQSASGTPQSLVLAPRFDLLNYDVLDLGSIRVVGAAVPAPSLS